MIQKISFSVLEGGSSLEDFLKKTYSKQSIKKFLKKSECGRKILKRDEISLPLDFINQTEINPAYSGPVIEVLYEDMDFIVFEKPHGVHGHPLKYFETNTVLNFLAKTSPQILQVNRKKSERGLLYRLDEETSGVLVYVKSEELWQDLRQNFKFLAREKIYEALVEGDCNIGPVLENRLLPSGPRGSVMKESMEGEPCSLEIIKSERKGRFTLLTLKLNEGIRHQIRAQLQAHGFPIVGDKIYGGITADRLYLHARRYVFKGKKEYCFVSQAKVSLPEL